MAATRVRRCAGRLSLGLLISLALVATAVVPTGTAATQTVQGAAYGHLTKFVGQYNAAGFSRVVKLGDMAIYRTTLSGLTVKVDPKLKPIAQYDPKTNTITFSKDPRKVTSAQSLDFGETVWHELTHAIEDARGDIGVFDSEAYAERNIDYMTYIVGNALPFLKTMEAKAKAGAKAATLEAYWRKFMAKVAAASTLPSVKQYPPNFETMRLWFGFKVNPEEVKRMYATNKAFSSKTWAQVRLALRGEPLSWTGEWNTNWGLMSLTQSGSTVTGAYTHDRGKIAATANGRTITGRWSEYPSYKGPTDAGTISFTISADGKTFAGTWTYDGGGGGGWTGTRLR